MFCQKYGIKIKKKFDIGCVSENIFSLKFKFFEKIPKKKFQKTLHLQKKPYKKNS